MLGKEISTGVKAVVSVSPQSIAQAASVDGASVDTNGFDEARVVGFMGAIPTGLVSTLKVQESADGSTGWADVTGASMAFADTEDDTIKTGRVKLLPARKRHLRLVDTIGAGTGSVLACGIIELGRPGGGQRMPVQADAFNV